MRTMGGVLVTVIVFITINNEVFGLNNLCDKNPSRMDCDECLRCDFVWCNLTNVDVHCAAQPRADWCPYNREEREKGPGVVQNGQYATPGSVTRSIRFETPDRVDFTLNSVDANETPGKLNSHILGIKKNLRGYIKMTTHEWKLNGSKWNSAIETTVNTEICNFVDGKIKYITIQVSSDPIPDSVLTLNYYIPCFCGCNEKKEANSTLCNNQGINTCGICECYNGWTGKNCSEQVCPSRGDIEQCNSNSTCNGNGDCDSCGICKCHSDEVYSTQLLDEFCMDPCTALEDCDYACFKNESCSDDYCPARNVTAYNETRLNTELDYNDNKKMLWKRCELIFEYNIVEYYATRHDKDYLNIIEIMIVNTQVISGGQVSGAGSVLGNSDGGSKVIPIVIGVLVAVAVAAAAGYMVYRHMNGLPPAPMKESQYTNIGAEDSTCVNPLYKPPTSSFKNPTYGKQMC